ncbi:hypothetical protein SDJN03_07034, partial [Cucurbita argyrosperma subsp. sororia]
MTDSLSSEPVKDLATRPTPTLGSRKREIPRCYALPRRPTAQRIQLKTEHHFTLTRERADALRRPRLYLHQELLLILPHQLLVDRILVLQAPKTDIRPPSVMNLRADKGFI